MAENRERLLGHGIIYPSGTLGLAQPESDAHHYLAHALRGRSKSYTPSVPFSKIDEYCSNIRELAARYDGPVVLSSEDLSLLNRQQIGKLAGLLPADTCIVVYLRRQDYWVDSLFGQMLKVGRKLSLQDFLKNIDKLLDYYKYLEPWAEAFGVQSIKVRTYENFSGNELWPDFCMALNVSGAVAALDILKRENLSLTKAQTDILTMMPGPGVRRALRRRFEEANKLQPRRQMLRHLDSDTAAQLLLSFQKSNDAVARKFLQRDQLFLSAAPTAVSKSDEAILPVFYETMAVVHVQLQKRLKRLLMK